MSPSYSHDHLGSVWYHSEPSEGPYGLFSKPVTGQELFFAVTYSKLALAVGQQASGLASLGKMSTRKCKVHLESWCTSEQVHQANASAHHSKLKMNYVKIPWRFWLPYMFSFKKWWCISFAQWSKLEGRHYQTIFFNYTNFLDNVDSFYEKFTNTPFQKIPIPHLTRMLYYNTRNMKQTFLH